MFQHLFWRYNRWLRAEFLPTRVCYISVRIYCFFKMFVLKTPLWFTATNPWFPLWGLYPSSKRDILRQLPAQRVPKSLYITSKNFSKESIIQRLQEWQMNFPLIIKPDNGLRWLGIEVFRIQQAFEDTIDAYKEKEQKWGSRLLQEFIDIPLEIWIFFIKDPKTNKWRITWMVEKEFLDIVWDWKQTFEELIHAHPRAKYHITSLEEKYHTIRTSIPPKWKIHTIVEIWSHSRWSTFRDISSKITPEITELCTEISSHIDWFYYGRYDVRTESIEALLDGKFYIIEVNPTYGEPTRMYDPSYNFITQQKILLEHWSMMYDIAKNNIAQWIPFASYKERKAAKQEFLKLWV